MAKELSRVGAAGLELTREDIADLTGKVNADIRKAQCREVNVSVLDFLDKANEYLRRADRTITEILETDD